MALAVPWGVVLVDSRLFSWLGAEEVAELRWPCAELAQAERAGERTASGVCEGLGGLRRASSKREGEPRPLVLAAGRDVA